MGFDDIVGQEVAVSSLQKAILFDMVNHAYLFSGPQGSGKKSLALLFARALNCFAEKERAPCEECLSCRKIFSGNHPDIYELKPEGSYLKIDQFREVKERLFYFPREGKKKVCLLHEADLLTLPAANSILKILEEPPQDLVFILLSSRPWALLPTVVSRCVHFPLKPLNRNEMFSLLEKRASLAQEEMELVISLSGGNPGRALGMASGDEWRNRYSKAFQLAEEVEQASADVVFRKAEELSAREDLLEIIDMLIIVYRNRLMGDSYFVNQEDNNKGQYKNKAGKAAIESAAGPLFTENICRELLRVRDQLPQNLNRRLALETLFLKMRGVV